MYLFIIFINGLFKYLRDKFNCEPVIDDINCLVHADDTILISTNRSAFIIKVNATVIFFKENKLTLNFSKSGFMIINPGKDDIRNDIILNNTILTYISEMDYLDVKISDSGSIAKDIKLTLLSLSTIYKYHRYTVFMRY